MCSKAFVVLLSLVVQCWSGDPTSRPEVKTDYGTYRGHLMKTREGRDILAFQGVPYAQPPIGEHRFKDPVRLDKREGTFDADTEAENCFQLKNALAHQHGDEISYMGSEDCLYLNIYTPPRKSTDDLLPVYFWIHGGGFFCGSGSAWWNGPSYLLDKDIVLVTINYRLHVLGFLSADDHIIPGNYGMKDQSMALKWVKENIQAFGGDPNLITVGGESAGAFSSSLHMISKASRGLFQRAISQSGTADCHQAIKPTIEARDMANKVRDVLGCPSEPSKLLKCLQEKSPQELLDAAESIKDPRGGLIIYFGPVVEKDSPNAFLTAKSIKEGSKLPWLTGVNSEEGLIFYQYFEIGHPGYIESVLAKNYRQLLPGICGFRSSPNADHITNKLKEFYFKNGFSATGFTQLISDMWFNHGAHISSRKYKGPLYMYLISYKGASSIAVIRPEGMEDGVSHADEQGYLFDNVNNQKLSTEKDVEFSKELIDMWYNFMKHGDPTPDTKLWKESDGGKRYLDMRNDGHKMRSDLFSERMAFLDKLQSRPIHQEL